MELQDAPANYLFKIWPWIETNKVRIASGAGVILVAAGLICFYSWQRDQKELTAGDEFTRMMISDQRNLTAVQRAGLYLKVARDNQNTPTAPRAFLQSATTLFEAGQYAEAQTQFQQFLDQYPDNVFASQAALGLAASLDAQGKVDLAVAAYQRVSKSYSDTLAANYAKFSLAQIDERQGKLTDALNLYEEIKGSNPNSQLGSEAGMLAMDLKLKQPSPSPAATTPAQFKLNP
jgi:predicted negative regulator of RcsB-dependent stress response